MRRAALTALVVELAISVALVTTAEAAVMRNLCAPAAVLRESPNGFVIARLQRPERLQVQRRSANRRWALVISRKGIAGWLPASSLCRA